MSVKKIDIDEFTDEFFEKYADLPVVEVNSVTWKSRPKTRIIKWLMQQGNVDQATMAAYLGCSKPYLDNKMTRNSFTIDDLVIAAYACGYTLNLTKLEDNSDMQESHMIGIVKYFDGYDIEVLERIALIKKEEKESKKAEYERKKAELEKMKEEYGFED